MTDDEIDWVFKALAHPERRRILQSLLEQPAQSLFDICVSSVVQVGPPLARQTISQHIAMMERAGLVEVTWKGRTKTHSVNLEPLRAAVERSLGRYL